MCMCINIIHITYTHPINLYTCTRIHMYNYYCIACTKRLTGIRSYDQIDSSDSDNGWLSCKPLPRNFECDLLCNVAMIDGDTQGRLKFQNRRQKAIHSLNY